MDKHFKFILPSPNFDKNAKDACKPKPHYLTPSGMSLLPREKQPPPMYGKHGATLPARYLKQQVVKDQQLMIPNTINPPEKQYCEPCEIELHSFEDLKRHRAQHEKCPVAGCLYKGHPSVMDKHINALHTSGLFDKFKKFSTPEEIAAWREERRKRYPTLANVLLKQKAKEQRQKRGERLESNKHRFGKINDRKRAQPIAQVDKDVVCEKRQREENKINHIKNKKNRKNKHKKSKSYEDKPKIQHEEKRKDKKVEEENELIRGGIKMFRGTCELENYNHFNEKKKAVTNNVLYGLVGMYGSDDDDEELEENNEVNEDNIENIAIVKTTDISSNCDSISIEPLFEHVGNNEVSKTEVLGTIEIPSFNSEEINITPTVNSIINKQMGNGTSQEDASDEAPEEISIERSMNTTPTSMNTTIMVNSIINKEIENCTSKESENSSDEAAEEIPKESSVNITPTGNTVNYIINKETENGTSKEKDNTSDEAPEEIQIDRSIPDYPIKSHNIPNIATFDEPDAKRSKLLQQTPISKKHLHRRKFGLDYRKARLRKQNTMLEKLLESDIRHERNVLLQCVRYVCENNFFDIGQNKHPENLAKNK